MELLGHDAREKLSKAHVAIMGVGGLGSMEAQLLAYLGVGRLILVDNDNVEEGNLDRQVMHWEEDLGTPKVYSAARKIRRINSAVKVETYRFDITRSPNLLNKVVSRVDIVLDGLDNWDARLAVDEAAWRLGKPFIHAGVQRLYGQVAPLARGKTTCLRCVLGVIRRGLDRRKRRTVTLIPAVAIVASTAVFEAVKIITGSGEPNYGKMIIIDLYSTRMFTVKLPETSECRCLEDEEANTSKH
ncbi:MAG: HesA/MoeB/ThiF family protein [Pyrodictiaceae archaeon]